MITQKKSAEAVDTSCLDLRDTRGDDLQQRRRGNHRRPLAGAEGVGQLAVINVAVATIVQLGSFGCHPQTPISSHRTRRASVRPRSTR